MMRNEPRSSVTRHIVTLAPVCLIAVGAALVGRCMGDRRRSHARQGTQGRARHPQRGSAEYALILVRLDEDEGVVIGSEDVVVSVDFIDTGLDDLG
jgi:hypothetical protein